MGKFKAKYYKKRYKETLGELKSCKENLKLVEEDRANLKKQYLDIQTEFNKLKMQISLMEFPEKKISEKKSSKKNKSDNSPD
jgi:predicted  nucleic acid-binding Zn-ribbon protein